MVHLTTKHNIASQAPSITYPLPFLAKVHNIPQTPEYKRTGVIKWAYIGSTCGTMKNTCGNMKQYDVNINFYTEHSNRQGTKSSNLN
ncbi:hypothetical protein BHE74_00047040 [Ensete ventricosum]|nr:hypothetical protein BHE74_00047040 [Ensete ventricosum]RZS14649.1 hypothetical protein BHM03_00046364 [Ensete ventricosum]